MEDKDNNLSSPNAKRRKTNSKQFKELKKAMSAQESQFKSMLEEMAKKFESAQNNQNQGPEAEITSHAQNEGEDNLDDLLQEQTQKTGTF